jgi:nitrogen regulatory protein PII-like uncharacterized protein
LINVRLRSLPRFVPFLIAELRRARQSLSVALPTHAFTVRQRAAAGHFMLSQSAVKRKLWGRQAISGLAALAILAAALPRPTLAQIASSSGIMSRADYEACQARDEVGFRQAIEGLTFKGLRVGLQGVDYRAVVNEEWRRLELDQIIDKQVDVATEEVKAETSWTNLIKSIASEEQAKNLAGTVAERVYKSDVLKSSIEALANSVGRALGKRIELATADTAEPAQQCMQAFLGPRYGTTVARMFARDAGKEYLVDPTKAGAEVTTGNVLVEGAGGITGAIIILVRRQIATMASRIGSRVVGSVMARVVGAVAGGVGLVLIAKDVWDFRNGVLPIIATEMKARATKDKVQEELARAIQEQIGDNIKEIAARTADRVLDIWQEFRRAHGKVLALAEAQPVFRVFLEQLKPEALGRLDEIVGLLSPIEGDAGVMKRLGDGTLNEAVNRMPVAAMDIARDTRSLDEALQWWALAGDGLSRVVEAEIHQRAKPAGFTKAGLTRLLALNDRATVMRLAGLAPASREVLLELDTSDLKTLGRALSEVELLGLSGYLTGLERQSATRILRAVAQTPAKMQVLARPTVRNGIVASREQATAVGMMLRSDVVPDPWVVAEHVRFVMDGKVAPVLLWEKHPIFVVSVGMLGLVLLTLLKRLVFGRRPKVVIQRVEVQNSAAPPIKTSKS